MGKGPVQNCFTSIEFRHPSTARDGSWRIVIKYLSIPNGICQVPLSHPLIQAEDVEVRKHQQCISSARK